MIRPELTEQSISEAENGEWRTKAACGKVSVGAANWFPGVGQGSDSRTLEAKRICKHCPVQSQCLIFSLMNSRSADGGIYGGLTSRERAKLKTQMRKDGIMVERRVCIRCNHPYHAKSMHVPRQDTYCDTCKVEAVRQWDSDHNRSGVMSRAKVKLKNGQQMTAAEAAAAEWLTDDGSV